MIANLFGPVKDRKHDSGMLGDSGLCVQLHQYARGHNITTFFASCMGIPPIP